MGRLPCSWSQKGRFNAMKTKMFSTEPMETNCYVCSSDGEAIVVDPGGTAQEIFRYIESEELTVHAVINTHGHGDHIWANGLFVEKANAEVLIHKADASYLTDPERNLSPFMGKTLSGPGADAYLQDGEQVQFGSASLTVIHTPGHTPGSICLHGKGVLFSGDTLFAGSQGRTDLPGGSEEQMQRSLQRLAQLPDDTVVYPGHGQPSTIGKEKRSNPSMERVTT